MKKIIILALISLIVSLPFYITLFLSGVGGRPNKTDKANYATRAKNFSDGKFHNLSETSLMHKTKELDSGRISKKATVPENPLPVKKPKFIENPSLSDFSVTWFGHSSFLIQMQGKNILFDPIFSRKISPVSFIGVDRFTENPIEIDELPEIDILIISHDHYDHLDYGAIRKLDSKVKKYIVPLGVEVHLRRWKIQKEKIQNLAWWENTVVDDLEISCVPARHFSGRWLTGRNETLWASWVLKDQFRQIFENADSGYGNHYREIHDRFGDFDFALMECGQYNLKWPQIHSFPEEGVKAMEEIGAKTVMPIHWGSTVLSDHPWDDPVERFVQEADRKNLNVITPFIGETVNFKEGLSNFKERWWRGTR